MVHDIKWVCSADWLANAVKFNSLRCFEYKIMNGTKIYQQIFISSIKDGNMAIIKSYFDFVISHTEDSHSEQTGNDSRDL